MVIDENRLTVFMRMRAMQMKTCALLLDSSRAHSTVIVWADNWLCRLWPSSLCASLFHVHDTISVKMQTARPMRKATVDLQVSSGHVKQLCYRCLDTGERDIDETCKMNELMVLGNYFTTCLYRESWFYFARRNKFVWITSLGEKEEHVNGFGGEQLH